MKNRTMLTGGLLVLAAALISAPVHAQPITSVPDVVNFQARLDSAGVPVPDGNYNVTFRLYESEAVTATVLWTEVTVQSVSGGLFTHNLGSATLLPAELFKSSDSLWLELEVNGEVQAPRIYLSAGPYSKVAGNLEVKNTGTPESNVVETHAPDHRISTYGNDEQEQVRIWGPAWGEIDLYDNSAANTQTVYLGANAFNSSLSGGNLVLWANDGSTQRINLDASQTLDPSVRLPASSISALETAQEAGVGNDIVAVTSNLSGSLLTMALRTLTCPSDGWVLVIGTAQANVFHSNGIEDFGIFGVSDNNLNYGSGQLVGLQIPSGAASGTYQLPVTVHTVFAVDSGSNTFYWLAEEQSGSLSVADRTLSAVFFSTAYGGVDGGVRPLGDDDPALKAVENPADERGRADAFNQARIEEEISQIREEMTTRIDRLELEMRQRQGTQAAADR